MFLTFIPALKERSFFDGWIIASEDIHICTLQLGRCRYFRSVSVFGIFRYFKSRYRYRCRYIKIPRYRYRFFSRPLLFSRLCSFPVMPAGFQTVGNACSTRLFVYGFLYGI